MLIQRTISSLVFAPLVLWFFYAGGWYFAFFLALVAALGAKEYRELVFSAGVPLDLFFAGISVAITVSGAFLEQVSFAHIIMAGALLVLSWSVVRGSFAAGAYALTGTVYIGGLFGCLGELRFGPGGMAWGFFVLAVTWGTDVGAYLGGVTWGRHKMVPSISPGKTWEGAACGLVLATAVGAYGAQFLSVPVWFGAAAGFVLSILGQLGDLVESMLKRHAGKKDSGALIPGHGGILDRFDSLLFTGTGGLLLRVLWGVLSTK